jgi:hypothetical protein
LEERLAELGHFLTIKIKICSCKQRHAGCGVSRRKDPTVNDIYRYPLELRCEGSKKSKEIEIKMRNMADGEKTGFGSEIN